MSHSTDYPVALMADAIYVNGNIVTADAAFSLQQAVAVRDGKIVAVGPTADVMALAGPATEVTDLDGRTMLPGLIDTHAHVELAGLIKYTVQLNDVTCVQEVLDRIAQQVAGARPGEWIRGGHWHALAQLRERRFLTRAELDTVAPDNPVCLPISHFTMVNSKALELAGIDRNTPDPEGGVIHRDPQTGEPNGVLEEAAEAYVHDLLPEWTEDELTDQVVFSMGYFNSHGITSAVSGAVSPAVMRAHQRVRDHGTPTLRLSAMFAPTGSLNPGVSLEEWETFFSRIGAASDFGDDWLSYSGVKLQIDGGMTFRTAAMRDGYPDDPDYKGTIVIETERFNALVAAANRYGWRVGVHAVGDAAIDTVLDAYELADRERSIKGRRFIVIHGSLIQRDQMERARRLDVRVDAQSAFMWDKAAAVARFLGKETADRAFPMRSLIDVMGLDLVAQGTDFPINVLDPFKNMYVMVARKDKNGDDFGPQERITREEAIRSYTSAAARYAFAETKTGTIEPGKLADMIVIDRDVLTVPEEELKSVRVLRTVVGGRIVHDSPDVLSGAPVERAPA